MYDKYRKEMKSVQSTVIPIETIDKAVVLIVITSTEHARRSDRSLGSSSGMKGTIEIYIEYVPISGNGILLLMNRQGFK